MWHPKHRCHNRARSGHAGRAAGALGSSTAQVEPCWNLSAWAQGLGTGTTLSFPWPRPVGAGQLPDPPQTHLPPRQEHAAAEPTQAAMPRYIPGRGWTGQRALPGQGALPPAPAPLPPCPSQAPAQIFVQRPQEWCRGTDPAANLFGSVAALSFGSSIRIKWFLNNTLSILQGHCFIFRQLWQPWECLIQNDIET